MFGAPTPRRDRHKQTARETRPHLSYHACVDPNKSCGTWKVFLLTNGTLYGFGPPFFASGWPSAPTPPVPDHASLPRVAGNDAPAQGHLLLRVEQDQGLAEESDRLTDL